MDTSGGHYGVDFPDINFYSTVGVVSGLGSAGRGYLAALQAAEISVTLVPVHELFFHQTICARRKYRSVLRNRTCSGLPV